MNLGRLFFKKAMREISHNTRCCHHHHETIASSLVKVATVAAGAAIANEAVKKHYNPDGLKGAFEDVLGEFFGTTTNKTTSYTQRIPYADNVIAKLAACTYVAKIDSTITGEEQAELDMSIADILSLENLPAIYRNEINSIRSNTDMSFSSIQPYLDRVDGNILVSYLIDIQNVARASGGISSTELKAIEVYKNYVTKRTGYTFPNDTKAAEVDLNCPGCGATMELDNTYGRAICPYCGTVKLIDIEVVNRILGK